MKRMTRVLGRTLAMLALGGSALWLGLAGGQAAVAAPTGSNTARVSSEPLTAGCNVVTLTNLTVGMKVSDYVSQNVQPASALISVWHFDNASQHYQALYFSDPAVPVDASTFTTSVDGFFFCVSASATAP